MLRILAAFIFFTRLPFWRLAEVPSEYFKPLGVSRLAHCRTFRDRALCRLTDTSGKRCRTIGNRHPPADNRLPARRRACRFLRRFRGRDFTRTYSFNHEGFTYRKLRGDRVDSLFCTSIHVVEQPAAGSCRKCDTGGRSFFQRSCRNDHQPAFLCPQGRRGQKQNGLQPDDNR